MIKDLNSFLFHAHVLDLLVCEVRQSLLTVTWCPCSLEANLLIWGPRTTVTRIFPIFYVAYFFSTHFQNYHLSFPPDSVVFFLRRLHLTTVLDLQPLLLTCRTAATVRFDRRSLWFPPLFQCSAWTHQSLPFFEVNTFLDLLTQVSSCAFRTMRAQWSVESICVMAQAFGRHIYSRCIKISATLCLLKLYCSLLFETCFSPQLNMIVESWM